jgi:hypothetical protein
MKTLNLRSACLSVPVLLCAIGQAAGIDPAHLQKT